MMTIPNLRTLGRSALNSGGLIGPFGITPGTVALWQAFQQSLGTPSASGPRLHAAAPPPRPQGPLASAEARTATARHEAAHVIVAASYGFVCTSVRVNRDGTGQTDFLWGAATPRQQLDTFLGGAVADEAFVMPGAGFDDDPYAALPDSDRGIVNTLVHDVAFDAKLRGHPASEMVLQQLEFADAWKRVQATLFANADTLRRLTDLLVDRSERDAGLTLADLARFPIVRPDA